MPRRFASSVEQAPRRALPIYPNERPATRAGCAADAMPRPCPFVSCRYHLVEIGAEGRAGKSARSPEDEGVDSDVARLVETTADTCALDVADRYRELAIVNGEPMAHGDVADKLGISRDAVKKIEASALDRLRGGLRAFLAASPIADELGESEAAPDLFNLATDTGYMPLGFE